MWAKIKKAINSTLGTQNFKPLDEIIKTEAKKITDDLSDGSFIVNRSKNDKYGREIDKSYYSLVGGEHMVEITTGTLEDVREAGNYYISWDNWFNNKVVGLPTDSRDGKGGAILTVELDAEPKANRIYQTLRFMNVPLSAEENDPIRNKSVVYHRDIDWEGGENLSKVISPWRRLVSAEEIENGLITIKAKNLGTKLDAFPIEETGIYTVRMYSVEVDAYMSGFITIYDLEYNCVGSSTMIGDGVFATVRYEKDRGIVILSSSGQTFSAGLNVRKIVSI